MIAMPEEFAQSAVDREREVGAAWLADLPGIVEGLLGRWGCTPDGEVMHGGVRTTKPSWKPDDRDGRRPAGVAQGPATVRQACVSDGVIPHDLHDPVGVIAHLG
jgi:hypothetical protein